MKRAIINYLRLILLKEPSFFLVVALNEAINNALFHSDVQPVEVWVKIRVSNHNRKIFIRVKNNGSGFDGNARLKELKDNPSAQFDHRLFEDGGRGILIMNSICDKVIYNQKGTELLLAIDLENDQRYSKV